VGTRPAVASDADKVAEVSAEAQSALTSLYATADGAKALGAKATAILVFPKVTKAGLGIGGQRGTGALLKQGKAVAYYTTTGGSFGLQAGVQTYGYAMFFMNEKALQQLDAADGFEVGVGRASSSWTRGWPNRRRPRPRSTTSTPSSSARKG
jgi:lipid-binding SYLF domain-containing protein